MSRLVLYLGLKKIKKTNAINNVISLSLVNRRPFWLKGYGD